MGNNRLKPALDKYQTYFQNPKIKLRWTNRQTGPMLSKLYLLQKQLCRF